MTILSRANDIIAWEEGTLSDEKTVELFQFLLDEGHCWRLQGFYGRFAEHLLQQGVIFERDKDNNFIKPDHPDYRYKDYVHIDDLLGEDEEP